MNKRMLFRKEQASEQDSLREWPPGTALDKGKTSEPGSYWSQWPKAKRGSSVPGPKPQSKSQDEIASPLPPWSSAYRYQVPCTTEGLRGCGGGWQASGCRSLQTTATLMLPVALAELHAEVLWGPPQVGPRRIAWVFWKMDAEGGRGLTHGRLSVAEIWGPRGRTRMQPQPTASKKRAFISGTAGN